MTRPSRSKGSGMQNEKGARPKGLGRKECLRIYDCLRMNKLAVNGGGESMHKNYERLFLQFCRLSLG